LLQKSIASSSSVHWRLFLLCLVNFSRTRRIWDAKDVLAEKLAKQHVQIFHRQGIRLTILLVILKHLNFFKVPTCMKALEITRGSGKGEPFAARLRAAPRPEKEKLNNLDYLLPSS